MVDVGVRNHHEINLSDDSVREVGVWGTKRGYNDCDVWVGGCGQREHAYSASGAKSATSNS